MNPQAAVSRFETAEVDGPSADAVRAQLDRMARSRTFASAPVLRRFLEHIVDSTLQGKTDGLKEYGLGVDVFGRGHSFEPHVDTIVRVQARRLRSRLEMYYRGEGRHDPVAIELPKGHYVPVFRVCAQPRVHERETGAEPAVMPIPADGGGLDLKWEASGESAGTCRATRDSGAAGSTAVPPHVIPPHRLWLGSGIGLSIAAILVAVLGFPTGRQSGGDARAVHPADTVAGSAEAPSVLAPRIGVVLFENRTADSTLDELGRLTAERMIRVIASVSGIEAIPQPIHTSGGPSDDAAKLAGGSRASLLVAGAYYRNGNALEFQARVLEAVTGRLLYAVAPITAPLTRPANALDQLEQKVAGAVAIHFDEFFGGLDAVAYPPSLRAYREYRVGLETFMSDYPRTLAHLERALERDPAFLLPLVIMYFAYGNLGEFREAEAVLAALEAQSDRLTPAERLLTEFLRANWEGRREHAFRVLEDLERLVPGSLVVNYNLVQQAVMLNRPRAAIDAYARRPAGYRSLRHSIGSYRFEFLTQALHMMGEHDRELAEVRGAQRYAPGVLPFVANEAKALAALGRVSEVTRVIDRSLSIGPTAGWTEYTPGVLMEQTARELLAHGYFEESRVVARRAVDWYRGRALGRDAPEGLRAGLGGALCLAGQWREAETVFSALSSERRDDLFYLGRLGEIAANRSDIVRARTLSEGLVSLSERLGRVRGNPRYFAALASRGRAGIAARLGQMERAVELLREAFALGLPYGPHIHNSPDLQLLQKYEPYRELVHPSE